MTNRNSYAVAAVFAACCVSYSSDSFAQPNPQEESVQTVASLYRTEEWPKGLVRDGFPLGSLELKGWQGGQLRSDSGRVRRKFTSTAKTEKPPTILIEMFVADSVASAQRNLSVRLAERQSAKPAPRAQDRELKVGDIGYLGTSGSRGNPIAYVEFVVGNIDVYIGNTDVRSHPELDLGAIAKEISQMILARPPLPPEIKPPLPAIERLSSEKQAAVAGDVLRLDLTITDPARGTPHIQWVVGGPGQGYVEANNNSWYLHTTKSGQISLSVEVTASTGTFASKETKIMVLPAKKR